jgi:hypothetical protein
VVQILVALPMKPQGHSIDGSMNQGIYSVGVQYTQALIGHKGGS